MFPYLLTCLDVCYRTGEPTRILSLLLLPFAVVRAVFHSSALSKLPNVTLTWSEHPQLHERESLSILFLPHFSFSVTRHYANTESL